MISLHATRHLALPVLARRARSSTATVARPIPARVAADQVSWGVVRLPRCLDVGDTARRAGIVGHAFPLGDDARALCGFRTPRRRLIDGSRRPLLALPGAHNPACPTCAERVAPAAGPLGVEAPGGDGAAWLRARLGIVETSGTDAATPEAAGDPRQPAVAVEADHGIGAWPLRDLLQHSSRHAWQTDVQVWPESVGEARHRVIESWQGVGRRSMASEGAGSVASVVAARSAGAVRSAVVARVATASDHSGRPGQESRRITGHRAWMERHRPARVAR